MGFQREYKAGDIIEYDDGKLDYLMRVSDEDELGVNACSRSWIERGDRSFGDEVYAFFGSGLDEGAKVVGHFGDGTWDDAQNWYEENKDRWHD